MHHFLPNELIGVLDRTLLAGLVGVDVIVVPELVLDGTLASSVKRDALPGALRHGLDVVTDGVFCRLGSHISKFTDACEVCCSLTLHTEPGSVILEHH